MIKIKRFYLLIKEKTATIFWAFRIAWKLNWKMLLSWSLLSAFLSILPTFALFFNREIVNAIAQFIDYGVGSYNAIIPILLLLGLVQLLIGVSNRVNFGLIYTMMYDSYYIGMQSLLMKAIQKISIIDLIKPDIYDNYNFSIGRAGSLTNAMSGFCIFIGKIVALISLMLVILSYNIFCFFLILAYVVFVLLIDIRFSDKVRYNRNKVAKDERYSSYLEKLPETPGVAKEIRLL